MNTKYEPSAFDDTWKDEFGAIYTFDKKKLIKGVNVPRYIIEHKKSPQLSTMKNNNMEVL